MLFVTDVGEDTLESRTGRSNILTRVITNESKKKKVLFSQQEVQLCRNYDLDPSCILLLPCLAYLSNGGQCSFLVPLSDAGYFLPDCTSKEVSLSGQLGFLYWLLGC